MYEGMSLKEEIIAYIREHEKARPNDLEEGLLFGRVAIYRNLKKLVEEGILLKVGKAPTVFYIFNQKVSLKSLTSLSPEVRDFLNKDYLYISPQGNILTGDNGFSVWLNETKQDDQAVHLAETYLKLRQSYDSYRDTNGLIDATEKYRNIFKDELYLTKIFFADFYSLAQFGKTRLGSLMLYAKQSQDRKLAKKVILEIKPFVERIIDKFEIDAIAYIPPSVPRSIQFITQMTKYLDLSLPRIAIVKSRLGEVVVAQKTLEKMEQRIVNARETIFVKETGLAFKNILIIDDAVGSGASFNETAKKLKKQLPLESKIYGFAIVGSFKGFDVIREV